jgi:hypothetical protein
LAAKTARAAGPNCGQDMVEDRYWIQIGLNTISRTSARLLDTAAAALSNSLRRALINWPVAAPIAEHEPEN